MLVVSKSTFSDITYGASLLDTNYIFDLNNVL